MAKCLHKGCIINGQENDAYNSVEVSTHMTVLYRDKCARDPSKHVLTLTSIPVSVSCTCVVPKYWGPPAGGSTILRCSSSALPLCVLFEYCNHVSSFRSPWWLSSCSHAQGLICKLPNNPYCNFAQISSLILRVKLTSPTLGGEKQEHVSQFPDWPSAETRLDGRICVVPLRLYPAVQ